MRVIVIIVPINSASWWSGNGKYSSFLLIAYRALLFQLRHIHQEILELIWNY